MSNTTEDIIARAAEAGVDAKTYMEGIQAWSEQEDEAWREKNSDDREVCDGMG